MLVNSGAAAIILSFKSTDIFVKAALINKT